ncbi:hypothetical protein LUZ60_006557 [Juncus effusus]|nr:hypothetical protein LUZ60_006557 [Juncus effusus]
MGGSGRVIQVSDRSGLGSFGSRVVRVSDRSGFGYFGSRVVWVRVESGFGSLTCQHFRVGSGRVDFRVRLFRFGSFGSRVIRVSGRSGKGKRSLLRLSSSFLPPSFWSSPSAEKLTESMSTLKFCRECNNMLYPKVDKENHELLYACGNCDYQEVSEKNIIYKMEIRKPSNETGTRTGMPKDVTADPSLPRTRSVKCANCKFPESVFFQAQAKGEEGLALYFVCCNPTCGHRWRD